MSSEPTDSGAPLSLDTDHFLNGVDYPHPFDQLAAALCAAASREVRILSPRLDHRVFDNADLVAALGALARGGRQTLVRILIQDSRQVVAREDRLEALSQERVFAEDPQQPEAQVRPERLRGAVAEV